MWLANLWKARAMREHKMEYQGGDGEKKNLIWNLKRKGISLLSEFEKGWERYMLKELGNQANFELELINAKYAADIGLSYYFTRFCIWTEFSRPIRVSNVSQIYNKEYCHHYHHHHNYHYTLSL